MRVCRAIGECEPPHWQCSIPFDCHKTDAIFTPCQCAVMKTVENDSSRGPSHPLN